MNNAVTLLRQLKEEACTPNPLLKLNIPGFDAYFLRPVPCRVDLIDQEDVSFLTKWRNYYVHAFLTEFNATNERTFRWLSQSVYKDNGRILFMIEDSKRQRVGYMGIAYIDWALSYVEADAIVSNGKTPRGLMSAALCTILSWAQEQLGLHNVTVRVLSDNPALSFYRKIGFIEIKRVPLRRLEELGTISWLESPSLPEADRYLVYHTWKNSENLN
jgi:RimJ/RimL family protein N-acetyltransferase